MRILDKIIVVFFSVVVVAFTLIAPAMAFEAEDILYGYGYQGWLAGLGISQENVKPLGFFGYEKTGIDGFVGQNENDDQISSWIGGHKQVFVGNYGYTLELFVANTDRPILSTFVNSLDPHIGAYGEFNRMYGDFGHGLSGTAQLFVNEEGQFEYCISPYVQFNRQGVWRFSASMGTVFGLGMSYLEPMEVLKFDVTLLDESLSFHVLLSVPEKPVTFGAGWTQERLQSFVRYTF
ncbi:MAG: hypothetical protein QM401_11030 [Bacillota bacterium]|nr:hypothetical protein [Bacillota bacterium]HHU60813.1 hypothetical protein [Natronincola sp.]